MNAGKTLFAQLMDFLPWSTFNRYVTRYSGDKGVRTMSCAEQFRVMAFAQLTYRESLRDIEGEPVLEIHEQDARARGIASGAVVRVFNDRGEYRVKAEVSLRARPGVVNGLGIWWRKFGLDGTNVNQLTSQKLTDLGRGPVFYDCLVDVQPVPPA